MQPITSLDDPRVAAYRNLRERTLRGESLFIAEASLVVQRLIESDFEVDSVLATDEQAADLAELAGEDVPVYVADRSLMVEIVGFPFHRGAMAIGRRRPTTSLDEIMTRLEGRQRLTFVICPEATQAENLGMVFRSAAAFGVDAVILGPKTCDPLSRRALRTSMGGVLRVPFVCAEDLGMALRTLREQYGVQMAGTVLADDACSLPEVAWPDRVGLMIGNEFAGLDDESLAWCDLRVTIPMAPGTDSLNLGVAAGVFMYERMRGAFGRLEAGD